jgi:hypothetical protein
MALTLAACSPSASVQGLPGPGRYAVQWTGYVAGMSDEAVYAQLAFIDIGAGRAPRFNQLELITEQGVIPAMADTITETRSIPSSDGSVSMFSVLVKVEHLAPGRYQWQRIRYVDERGVERELHVGQWLFDILAADPAPLVQTEGTVGATAFGIMEATLQNQSQEGIEILGLAPLELPGVTTTSEMRTSDEALGESSSASGAPAPGGDSSAVDEVFLAAGATTDIAFQIATEPLDAGVGFAVIRPMLIYRHTDRGGQHLFGVSMQVYATAFEAVDDVAAYLAGLPDDASYGWDSA